MDQCGRQHIGAPSLRSWSLPPDRRITLPVSAAIRDNGSRLHQGGERAFVARWDAGVVILDLSDPSRPEAVGRTASLGYQEGNSGSTAFDPVIGSDGSRGSRVVHSSGASRSAEALRFSERQHRHAAGVVGPRCRRSHLSVGCEHRSLAPPTLRSADRHRLEPRVRSGRWSTLESCATESN